MSVLAVQANINEQDQQAWSLWCIMGYNEWDWQGWWAPQCTGVYWQYSVLKRVKGQYRSPWPACWDPEGRCAGGVAGERTHSWDYAHWPSWPDASEAEWGVESTPLAVAKPRVQGARRPVKTQRRGWEKIFENHVRRKEASAKHYWEPRAWDVNCTCEQM